MSRQDKIKAANKLDTEIAELKEFMRILEEYWTKHEVVRDSFFPAIKRTVIYSFLGLFKTKKNIEIKIPEKVTFKIASECRSWILELETRADNLIADD